MSATWTRALALVALLTLAACSGSGGSPAPAPSQTATTDPAATAVPASTAPSSDAPGDSPTPSAPADAPSVPPAGATFDQPWAVAVLTDVSTGAQFRIADLAAAGKVVFVETMAIWCANCRAQQVAATEALAQLDPATVEWVAVDVETTETADALARYRDQHGFPFRYAIADTALSRSLAEQFGDVVLSPPTVNTIILGTDGRITHLRGHHSSADLVALAVEHGS